MAIVCSPPNMAPFGAKAAGLHNSPIALAVPAGRHPPLSLDMATSIVAAGKFDVARDKGIAVGEGWALGREGKQQPMSIAPVSCCRPAVPRVRGWR